MLMNMLVVTAVICLVVIVVVDIHYVFLYRITRILPRLNIKHRYRIVLGVCGSLVAHTVEVLVFAVAYHVMVTRLGWGSFVGSYSGTLQDCVYFSFTTYTTLGFGDIEPIGYVRYLTGIESLTGLVLITWTASFLYLEMLRDWNDH